MLFKVQHRQPHWQVVHPTRPDPIAFGNGATAFDFAASLAREHHASTGDSSAVRVEVLDAGVEALRYG